MLHPCFVRVALCLLQLQFLSVTRMYVVCWVFCYNVCIFLFQVLGIEGGGEWEIKCWREGRKKEGRRGREGEGKESGKGRENKQL